MTNLREQPLRLEQALTQDYVNRAVKLREITERIDTAERRQRLLDRLAWTIAVVLLGLAALVWWLQ